MLFLSIDIFSDIWGRKKMVYICNIVISKLRKKLITIISETIHVIKISIFNSLLLLPIPLCPQQAPQLAVALPRMETQTFIPKGSGPLAS